MATVGQQLTVPEAEWKRIGNSDLRFLYLGNWFTVTNSVYYNGSLIGTDLNGKLSFTFKGTKLRIITDANTDHSNNIKITIDGQSDNFSICSSPCFQRLSYEKAGLSAQVHTVELVNLDNKSFGFNAIDIDENGELLPYNPDEKSDQALLRVTMLDSSEREYRLPIKEVEGFINWYKRTLGTGDSCYELSDIVDNGKEYLSFEKIISFKVIPLKNKY